MKTRKWTSLKGSMAVHVTGLGSRTPGEPVLSHTVEIELRQEKDRFWVRFPVDHPVLPVYGTLACNLSNFTTDRFDFSLYRMEAIQVESKAFLLLINYCWRNIRSKEFFQGVARFSGQAPTELYPRFAPY